MNKIEVPPMWVRSRSQAECFTPPPNCVAISIRESIPYSAAAKQWVPSHEAELHPDFVEVLHLVFDDVDGPTPGHVHMDIAHARQIVEFVRKHLDKDGILIHCWGGISRSTGCALGIMDAFEQEIPWEMEKGFPHHNRLVRSLIRSVTLGPMVSGERE